MQDNEGSKQALLASKVAKLVVQTLKQNPDYLSSAPKVQIATLKPYLAKSPSPKHTPSNSQPKRSPSQKKSQTSHSRCDSCYGKRNHIASVDGQDQVAPHRQPTITSIKPHSHVRITKKEKPSVPNSYTASSKRNTELKIFQNVLKTKHEQEQYTKNTPGSNLSRKEPRPRPKASASEDPLMRKQSEGKYSRDLPLQSESVDEQIFQTQDSLPGGPSRAQLTTSTDDGRYLPQSVPESTVRESQTLQKQRNGKPKTTSKDPAPKVSHTRKSSQDRDSKSSQRVVSNPKLSILQQVALEGRSLPPRPPKSDSPPPQYLSNLQTPKQLVPSKRSYIEDLSTGFLGKDEIDTDDRVHMGSSADTVPLRAYTFIPGTKKTTNDSHPKIHPAVEISPLPVAASSPVRSIKQTLPSLGQRKNDPYSTLNSANLDAVSLDSLMLLNMKKPFLTTISAKQFPENQTDDDLSRSGEKPGTVLKLRMPKSDSPEALRQWVTKMSKPRAPREPSLQHIMLGMNPVASLVHEKQGFRWNPYNKKLGFTTDAYKLPKKKNQEQDTPSLKISPVNLPLDNRTVTYEDSRSVITKQKIETPVTQATHQKLDSPKVQMVLASRSPQPSEFLQKTLEICKILIVVKPAPTIPDEVEDFTRVRNKALKESHERSTPLNTQSTLPFGVPEKKVVIQPPLIQTILQHRTVLPLGGGMSDGRFELDRNSEVKVDFDQRTTLTMVTNINPLSVVGKYRSGKKEKGILRGGAHQGDRDAVKSKSEERIKSGKPSPPKICLVMNEPKKPAVPTFLPRISSSKQNISQNKNPSPPRSALSSSMLVSLPSTLNKASAAKYPPKGPNKPLVYSLKKGINGTQVVTPVSEPVRRDGRDRGLRSQDLRNNLRSDSRQISNELNKDSLPSIHETFSNLQSKSADPNKRSYDIHTFHIADAKLPYMENEMTGLSFPYKSNKSSKVIQQSKEIQTSARLIAKPTEERETQTFTKRTKETEVQTMDPSVFRVSVQVQTKLKTRDVSLGAEQPGAIKPRLLEKSTLTDPPDNRLKAVNLRFKRSKTQSEMELADEGTTYLIGADESQIPRRRGSRELSQRSQADSGIFSANLSQFGPVLLDEHLFRHYGQYTSTPLPVMRQFLSPLKPHLMLGVTRNVSKVIFEDVGSTPRMVSLSTEGSSLPSRPVLEESDPYDGSHLSLRRVCYILKNGWICYLQFSYTKTKPANGSLPSQMLHGRKFCNSEDYEIVQKVKTIHKTSQGKKSNTSRYEESLMSGDQSGKPFTGNYHIDGDFYDIGAVYLSYHDRVINIGVEIEEQIRCLFFETVKGRKVSIGTPARLKKQDMQVLRGLDHEATSRLVC